MSSDGNAARAGHQAPPLQEITIHGRRVTYRTAGSGPVIVLLHGITGTNDTWRTVIGPLAERHTVLAPDLLGHGGSARPHGDYSLGAYASGVRDLLLALGHDRATFVGHSLGGGVAMQAAYQFPERCERLVLVSSGGLGREVSALLRAATVPGSEVVLPLLTSTRVLGAGRAVARLIARAGLRPGADLEEIARGHASLADKDARRAFVQTVRSVMDPGGQRVDARDRLYLAQVVPSLIVWGERDPLIPAVHGRRAAQRMPDSRFELFERAGHFPQLHDPGRFVAVLQNFLATTEPARYDEARLRALLRGEGGS
ncbi:MAG TPA: alpha/beta fold hydrolase [Solirubrobacteraceae bacterium]|nr:alpha/beta fold hydrolase [Solirubrobacteraceae bacterium]